MRATDTDRNEADDLVDIRDTMVRALNEGDHRRATELAKTALRIAESVRNSLNGELRGQAASVVRYVAFLQFMVGNCEAARRILEGFRLARPGSVSFYQGSDTYPEHAETGALKNVVVEPSSWLVSDPDAGIAYTGRTASFSFKIPDQHIWQNDGGAVLYTENAQKTRIQKPVYLLGSKVNYKHWITDYLPRAMHYLERGISAPILIGENPTRFQIESLTMAGISEDNIIRVPANEQLLCDALHVGPLPRRMERVERWAMNWLTTTYSPKNPTGPERIYVSRGDANTRRVLNEDDIIQRLAQLGFEAITPGALNFSEQVDIFANASIVVGMHGAGLANIAFTRPDARLIEIIPAKNRETEIPSNASGFMRMVAASNRRHQFFPATSADTKPFSKDSDVLVHAEALVSLIERG